MEDLPLGRIAALVPEFAVKDLHLGRTLMMMKAFTAGVTTVKHLFQAIRLWSISIFG